MTGTHRSHFKIALVGEYRSTYAQLGYSEDDCAVLPHDGEIQAVLTSLQNLGHHVTMVPGIQPLVQHLAAGEHKDWDLVFNMAQGFHGPSRESQVPALLEAYQVPYTFADAATMAVCQNKALTKITLNHNEIPTAAFVVITPEKTSDSLSKLMAPSSHYPLFVKPTTEGLSKGVGTFNKVHGPAELKQAVQRLQTQLPGEHILVEPFLSGREFTVGILGTGANSRVIGIREHCHIKNKNGSPVGLDFTSRKDKSGKEDILVYNDHHDMDNPQIKAACQVSLDAWNVFGCRDAGRVGIRFDTDKPDCIPNVLEVNPISGLLPGHSPLPACAAINGIPFEKLLADIIDSTLRSSTAAHIR